MKKKNNPLISVIINCYNGEKFIKQCIDSVRNQNYKNWEIIFWDNLSSDKSRYIFLKYKDKRLRYFKSNKHTTLYKARNLAIKKAKGFVVTFLDIDDIWPKNKLSLQINHFLKNHCQASYTNLTIVNENKKTKKIFEKKILPSGKITQELLDNYKIGIITAMIRRSIFTKLKFKDNFQIIGDFDFFLRLSKKYKICSMQQSLAIYRVHDKNFSSIKFDLYVQEFRSWLKFNSSHFQKEYNLNKLKLYVFIIFLKNLFKKILFKN